MKSGTGLSRGSGVHWSFRSVILKLYYVEESPGDLVKWGFEVGPEILDFSQLPGDADSSGPRATLRVVRVSGVVL